MTEEYRTLVDALLRNNVKSYLWTPILNGNGFRDQKLPLDWYEVIKDRYGILQAVTMEEQAQYAVVYGAIEWRLSSIQVRIIGGQEIGRAHV